MSLHVSSLVWKLECPPTVKLVLVKLADHARDDGSHVSPKQKTVARETGLTDRSVRNALTFAIERGWLVPVETPANRPNEYCFVIENLKPGGTTFQVETDSRRKEVPAQVERDSASGGTTFRPLIRNRQLTINEPLSGWEKFLASYPKRSGDLGKAKGKAKFEKLVEDGTDPELIIAGVRRYADFLRDTDKIGTQYVKQIPTFLNGRGWEEDYSPPRKAPTLAENAARIARELAEIRNHA